MVSENNFRALETAEINALAANNCFCDDWSDVKVSDGFDPSRCINVLFSGQIRLGNFRGSVTDKSGVSIRSGIYNAHIHNCSIGSDVLISNIGDYIANYRIEDDVTIKNCSKIHVKERHRSIGTRLPYLMKPAAALCGYGINYPLPGILIALWHRYNDYQY
jgi:hypothetical protein